MKENKENPQIQRLSTEHLQQLLAEESELLIIDTQPNVHDYISEHLPTAVYFNENHFRIPKHGLPAVYAADNMIQSALRQIGLKKEVKTVVYSGKGAFKGWGDGLEQNMVAYSLSRFGHNDVCILDGGMDKWKKEQKALTQSFPKYINSSFTVNPRTSYTVSMDEVKEMKGKSNVILLDARPHNLYNGSTGPWIRNGHIPDAINLPWKRFMNEANPYLLKPFDQIQSILDEKQITKDKTIICSCGTGREATAEFILFKWYLNYPDVKIYEGSYTEWTAYPSNPTIPNKPVTPQQRIM